MSTILKNTTAPFSTDSQQFTIYHDNNPIGKASINLLNNGEFEADFNLFEWVNESICFTSKDINIFLPSIEKMKPAIVWHIDRILHYQKTGE